MLNAAVDRLAGEWPTEVEADPSLRRSIAFLGIDADANALLAAGYALGGGVLVLVPLVVLVVPPGLGPIAVVLSLVAAGSVVLAARDGPQFLARVRRTRALVLRRRS